MDYKIRGRIHTATGAGYTVIAEAVPSGNGAPARELQDSCSTRALAVVRLRALVVELGALIRREGGQVLDVQTED